jgi:hypothetical protein
MPKEYRPKGRRRKTSPFLDVREGHSSNSEALKNLC